MSLRMRDDHMTMPSSKIFIPSLNNRHARGAGLWTPEDLNRLRELAKNGASVRLIATILRRTESAIRNKAGMHGISLMPSRKLIAR